MGPKLRYPVLPVFVCWRGGAVGIAIIVALICARAAAEPTSVDQAKPPMLRSQSMKLMWKRNWTHGSKKTRICLKCGCVLVGLTFATAISLASLALYYSISCASLGDYKGSFDLHSVGTGADTVIVFNNYSRGSITVCHVYCWCVIFTVVVSCSNCRVQ